MFALMFFVLLTGEWVGHELLGGRARWRHSSAYLAITRGVCVVVVGGWIASAGGGGGGWPSANVERVCVLLHWFLRKLIGVFNFRLWKDIPVIDEFSGCERRDKYGMEILDGTWGVTASLMR